MQLIILGSGTGIPYAGRSSPSLAMRLKGRLVLFDMGPGALVQLLRAGLDFKALNHVFLTHFHPDHTAGLIRFLFATRNPEIAKGRNPFTISGPAGLEQMVSLLGSAFSGALDLPEGLMIIEEFSPEDLNEHHYPGFTLRLGRTRHTEESIAYRVEETGGKSFVYTGDAAFCNDLVELARGADLLVAECSFPDKGGTGNHLTPSLAGRIADRAGVNRLVLTHFYPEVLRSDVASQCRKTYSGELTLACDLLHIQV